MPPPANYRTGREVFLGGRCDGILGWRILLGKGIADFLEARSEYTIFNFDNRTMEFCNKTEFFSFSDAIEDLH